MRRVCASATAGTSTATGRRVASWLAVMAALVAACAPGPAGAPGEQVAPVAGERSLPAPVSPDSAPVSPDPGVAAGGLRLAEVRVHLRQLARLDAPVALAWRPRDPRRERVYVAEQGGRVVAVDPDGRVDPTPLADLRDRTVPGGERGLLGLVFSPDGEWLYVNYTDRNGDTNVDELPINAAGTADLARRRSLLRIEQPFANHNGGHLAVDADGLLYIGTGDGGSAGDPRRNAQDLGSLLGKLLRIDPRPSGSLPYTVPAGNPFVGRPGARPEIYAYGLRNPWRFSFDPATGDLWIGDVGQNRIEEIDVVRAADGAGRGANFGWNAFEGSTRFETSVTAPDAVTPVHEYRHGTAAGEGCSVTGGLVYRGDAIAGLAGAYLFADHCVPGVRALPAAAPQGVAAVQLDGAGATEVVAFGAGPDGEVLMVSHEGGVFRLLPAG